VLNRSVGDSSRRRVRDRRAAVGRFWRVLVIVLVAAVGAAVAVVALRALNASRELQTLAVFFSVFLALLGAILLVVTESTEPIGILGAAVALAIGVVGALNYLEVIEPDPPVGCLNSDGPIEASVASDKTIVSSKATALSDARRLLLPGCTLKFTGYCIGAVHGDAIQGEDVREARWLILDDNQGLIASGDTVGTIDPDIKPSPCPGGLNPPGSPVFASAVLDSRAGLARLDARAERAAYVGFAIEQPGNRWRRLGWDRLPGDDAPMVFQVPAGTQQGARVAAATCIGVQRHLGHEVILALRQGAVTPPKTSPTVRQPTYADAALAACDAGLPEPDAGA